MESHNTLSITDLSYTPPDDNPYKLITRRIDSTKIRCSHKRDLQVNTCLTEDLPSFKQNHIRSGAIIYTHDKDTGETYFCLGVDTQSGDLTDFGGGVKKDESVVVGGLRELKEESQGIFGHLDPDDIKNTLTFYCYNMAIIFIKMRLNRDQIQSEFRYKVRTNPAPEVRDIVWLTTDEFLESIHGRGKKLYIRVRKLLSKVTNSIRQL